MLESFALEGYRSGKLTEEQIRRILGFGTRVQRYAFLKEHDVYFNYGVEDLEQDIETLRQIPDRELAQG